MVATPLDLQKGREFKKSFRGYRPKDVDSYINKVLKDYEQIYRQNLDLQEQLQELQEKLNHYTTIEHTLQETLVLAQQAAEEVKKNGEKEAALLLEQARLQGENMIRDAEARVKEIRDEYARLQQLEAGYRTHLKAFFQAQLLLLEQEFGGDRVEERAAAPVEEPEEAGSSLEAMLEEAAASVGEEEKRSLGLCD
ncbi:MAG TPA: DivIVA domain-containing protein [Clostridia bacterium]|nr:DivIVA domain-containing protein [Clostridia bacterium]